MLRSKPKLTYCGLTVVLSNPSRFDRSQLLSANGGVFFNDECLRPHYNKHQCDVRVKEDREPLLPNTKAVLLLGESAMHQWTGKTENSLGEMRGSPLLINGIPHIASFSPQDCVDHKDHETRFNPHLKTEAAMRERKVKITSAEEKRHHGKTSRSNYGFWLRKDTEKIIRIMQHGIPSPRVGANYIYYPNSADIIRVLFETKNEDLYLDIETDPAYNIKCLAFSFGLDPNIYCVPILDYRYYRAYDDLHRIYRALVVAFQDNCVVTHNGSGFDLVLLAGKYRIPPGKRLYDTMLAENRIYPDTEKSLGHCTSLWTYEEFHKDMGNVGFWTAANMEQLNLYCGKDVYTTKLVHLAQLDYAKKKMGLLASIEQANQSIRPYLLTTLLGMHYDVEAINERVALNDKLMNRYIKLIEILVGPHNMKDVRAGIKKAVGTIASSPAQAINYFHNMLGYPAVARTLKGNPSLDAKAMYKLRLKYDNPVIDTILAYRSTAKETGTLQFIPWKDEQGNTP